MLLSALNRTVVGLALLVVAQTGLGAGEGAVYDKAADYYSYANTDAVITTHLALDIDVDFDTRTLAGTATLRLQRVAPSVPEVHLDTRDLTIKSARVRDVDGTWQDASYTFGRSHELLGRELIVSLPAELTTANTLELALTYQTSPSASALQWLPSALTAGGNHPMMFSQSQAIHARSWVPLQDSPAVRITYDATVRTPDGMRALMSANNDPQADNGMGEYTFEMPQPIPSYLLAIAVGNFAFAPVGENTGVYAEPELIEASTWEFDGTQAMLDLAEQRFGPYEWGRYDLLILPPSFPYGGMENPRLSFITPSVLAGDRSLVSLIAHELAHSWSGNLITNATWRDIWLNEGTTSYLEARLMESLYGKARTDEERVLQWNSLQADILSVPTQFQPLAPERVLPEDGESPQHGMQYAKGQFFLEYLEHEFGRERFDPFMASYFKAFAWQSITTETFLEFLDTHLLQVFPNVVSREDVSAWLYQPGVPKTFEPPTSPTLAAAASAAHNPDTTTLAALDSATWSPQAVVHFINNLPTPLSTEQLAAVDKHFDLTKSRNAEINRAWFIQVAKRRYLPGYPALEAHLGRHGRMRLVVPVYKALAENGKDASLAKQLFETWRNRYHPITISRVEEALMKTAGSGY